MANPAVRIGDRADVDSWLGRQSVDDPVEPAESLDRVGLHRPGRYTHPVVLRRCTRCGQRNIVRDDEFTCAACDETLPARWNFDG